MLSIGARPAFGASTILKVLQLNLCNSGFAPCYALGQSIPEAAALIAAVSPDVVTLNEICERDITRLAQAMGNTENWSFSPAYDEPANAPVRCANGDPYGVGLLLKANQPKHATSSGRYDYQTNDTEQRAYACAYSGYHQSEFYACVTHLDTTSATAMAQCHELMDKKLSGFRSHVGVGAPAVVGGDLNLKDAPGSPNDVQGCVPNGYLRKGDGDVQHVMAENYFLLDSSRSIELRFTDHPAWLVQLRAPWPAPPAARRR